jgi:hypothetical protein
MQDFDSGFGLLVGADLGIGNANSALSRSIRAGRLTRQRTRTACTVEAINSDQNNVPGHHDYVAMSGYGILKCASRWAYSVWKPIGSWSRSNRPMNSVSVRNGCAPSSNSFG